VKTFPGVEGSIAYGEFAGRQARAGGWGELFSDEGSAYWIAREGLNPFSRMSDGRARKGPLYDLLRDLFQVTADLDSCGAVYGQGAGSRSAIAQLASIVADAARAGDTQARAIFAAATKELLAIVGAVREQLRVSPDFALPVSHSGGMFKLTDLTLEPLKSALRASPSVYEFVPSMFPPAVGAALYAARTFGAPLTEAALGMLKRRI